MMMLDNDFLSDGGGVFGFFLGVTMLNCLQTTFEHTLNWSSKIRKRKREKVFTVNQECSVQFRIGVLSEDSSLDPF